MSNVHYKTWVRTKPIIIFFILAIVSLFLSLCSFFNYFFLLFIIPTVTFIYILLIISISRYQFSKNGGNYQYKIHSIISEKVEGNKILDIGCGSGHLLSRIAKQNPESELVGIDYYGENWEYSKDLCLKNFYNENITNKYEFLKGTASNLPNDIGFFDCVVSCLTFHEVRDVNDKTISISEALQHLNKGGKFVFFDLFKDPNYYPNYKKIEEIINSQNGIIIERYSLSEIMKLPYPLNHKKVLGYSEIIIGKIKE